MPWSPRRFPAPRRRRRGRPGGGRDRAGGAGPFGQRRVADVTDATARSGFVSPTQGAGRRSISGADQSNPGWGRSGPGTGAIGSGMSGPGGGGIGDGVGVGGDGGSGGTGEGGVGGGPRGGGAAGGGRGWRGGGRAR